MNAYLEFAKALVWDIDASLSALRKVFTVSAGPGIELPPMRGFENLDCLPEHLAVEELFRIQTASHFIQRTNKYTWQFVLEGTEVLFLRQSTTAESRFGSGSFRQCPGVHVVINPHLVPMEYLADAIIHEAIHTRLFAIEKMHGTFFKNQEHVNDSLHSPWTGNVITHDNLTQACFVWFGLYHFWSFVCDQHNNFAQQTKDRIRRGFRNLSFQIWKNSLRAPVLETIQYIQGFLLDSTC